MYGNNMAVNAISRGFNFHSKKVFFLFYFYFEFFALVLRQIVALIFAAQHAVPSEFGGKWGTKCLNTRIPLPTLPCMEYSVCRT